MTAATLNRRQQNAARTRERLVDAAVKLYGQRSIDAVSLREISVAAGQKNPNALQYHFRDRDGLLQAIIDKHASNISSIRESYLQRAEGGEWSPPQAAARSLVLPIVDYVEVTPGGLNFVKVVSQIAAIYQNGTAMGARAGIVFPRTRALEEVFEKALAAVPPEESQQRIYLIVTTTFHTIADIYRAVEQPAPKSPVAEKNAMVAQLICLLDAYLSAPSLSRQ